MKKLNVIKTYGTSTVVGVIGTAYGVGVTHLSLAVAVFLSSVAGKSVALADMSGTDCFRQAGIMLKNNFHKKNRIFKMISIYEQSDSSVLPQLMSEGYDYVIVDFGFDYSKNYQQFLMCGVKLVVGSLCWWKIHSYVEFLVMTEWEKSRKHWIFLAPFPGKDGIRYFKHNFNIYIRQIPCIPDPLYLNEECMDFLQKLVGEFYTGRRKWRE